MKLNLYSIHDRLMGVYLAPFPARGDVDACRQIAGTLKDPQMAQAAIVVSPQDYDLACVAVFDDETGEMTSQRPTVVKRVAELVPGGTHSSDLM